MLDKLPARELFKRQLCLIFILSFLYPGCESTTLSPDSPGPTKSISYSITTEAHVKLILENSYNTLVAVLVDDFQNAGVYQINFDTYEFSEGVYFYTLIVKDITGHILFEATRNMILIK